MSEGEGERLAASVCPAARVGGETLCDGPRSVAPVPSVRIKLERCFRSRAERPAFPRPRMRSLVYVTTLCPSSCPHTPPPPPPPPFTGTSSAGTYRSLMRNWGVHFEISLGDYLETSLIMENKVTVAGIRGRLVSEKANTVRDRALPLKGIISFACIPCQFLHYSNNN